MNLSPESRPDRLLSRLAHGAGIAGAIWRHPGNRQRRIRGLARFLGWQFVKHALNRPVVISFHGKPERTGARIEEQAAMNGLNNLRLHRFAISSAHRGFVAQRLRQSATKR